MSRLKNCGSLSEFRWGWFAGQGAAAGGVWRGRGRREPAAGAAGERLERLENKEGKTWNCLCLLDFCGSLCREGMWWPVRLEEKRGSNAGGLSGSRRGEDRL